jgi:signal peptidase
MGAAEALIRSDGVRQAARLLSFVVLGTVVGALLLVAAATVPILFGYHTYTVDGGSMEPTLRLGSVAVAKPTAPAALEIGDIIAYRTSPDSTRVLHRVVGISKVDGKLAFFTQGDRNEAPDIDPVVPVGPGDKVVYSVPYAGYILNFAQSWLGRALLLGVPIAGLIVNPWRERRSRPRAASSVAQDRPAAVPIAQPQPLPVEQPQAAPIVTPLPAPARAAPRPATPAQVPPGQRGQTVAPLRPAGEATDLVLTNEPTFRVLIQAVRALSGLPAVRDITIVEFHDGQALLELRLREPVTARQITQHLRAAGIAVVREAAPHERLRLRFLNEPERVETRRAA